MKPVNILDCTIRDGGYYNNWNFDIHSVKSYLNQIYKTKIKVVEIGFNFFNKKKNYGPFALSKKSLLTLMPNSKNIKFALMINADELIRINLNEKTLRKIFSPKLKFISIIRIATHYKDAFKTIKYANYLKKIGFRVFINLMQINIVSKKNLEKLLQKINDINCYEVFYFADSFGNLNPSKVKKICNIIKKNWSHDIGFHSHDNCDLALKNVITAYSNGVKWIDSTMQGMGRGAGNVKTEDVLKLFYKKNSNLKKIRKTSLFFNALKKKYNWGPSKYYRFAAKYNIHPTYIQELQKDDRYNKKDTNYLIKYMSTLNAKSYDPDLLEKIYLDNNFKGNWNAKNWLLKKNLLIIGQGPSVKKRLEVEKIKKFITKHKPVVVSININKYFPKKFVDYYVSFNDTRILVDHKKYLKLNKPLIIPSYMLKKISQKVKIKNTYNYGAKVDNNKFIVKDKYCILPNKQSFAYILALAKIGNPDRVFIFGFDGFTKGHHSNSEMSTIFKMFYKNSNIPLNSLNKTIYKIK